MSDGKVRFISCAYVVTDGESINDDAEFCLFRDGKLVERVSGLVTNFTGSFCGDRLDVVAIPFSMLRCLAQRFEGFGDDEDFKRFGGDWKITKKNCAKRVSATRVTFDKERPFPYAVKMEMVTEE